MQEIITWLRSIELLAGKLYLEAACNLEDRKYSSFLSRLSEEESWHYHIIGSAAQYFLENDIHPNPAIQVDAKLKREVEIPFHELSGLLANKLPNMGGIEFYRNAVGWFRFSPASSCLFREILRLKPARL